MIELLQFQQRKRDGYDAIGHKKIKRHSPVFRFLPYESSYLFGEFAADEEGNVDLGDENVHCSYVLKDRCQTMDTLYRLKMIG